MPSPSSGSLAAETLWAAGKEDWVRHQKGPPGWTAGCQGSGRRNASQALSLTSSTPNACQEPWGAHWLLPLTDKKPESPLPPPSPSLEGPGAHLAAGSLGPFLMSQRYLHGIQASWQDEFDFETYTSFTVQAPVHCGHFIETSFFSILELRPRAVHGQRSGQSAPAAPGASQESPDQLSDPLSVSELPKLLLQPHSGKAQGVDQAVTTAWPCAKPWLAPPVFIASLCLLRKVPTCLPSIDGLPKTGATLPFQIQLLLTPHHTSLSPAKLDQALASIPALGFQVVSLEDNYFANKLHQREKRALTLGSRTGSQTTTGPEAAVSLAKEEKKDLPSRHTDLAGAAEEKKPWALLPLGPACNLWWAALWPLGRTDPSGVVLPASEATQSKKGSKSRVFPDPLNRGWCSTWGGGHFSTFDKHLYDFSGTCNYIFAAVCNDASPDFDIQLRRGGDRKISRIIIEVGPSVIIVENSVISIKDAGVVSLPYTCNGIQIMPFGQNVRLVAKLLEMELVVMWNDDDYLMVMVETKYMKKTCGLCGDFDREETNEFQSEGGKFLEPYEYAALQKLDDPTEICAYEELPMADRMPRNHTQLCLQLLTQVGPNCNVSKAAFAARCQLDLETCPEPARPNCSCPTLSEYSRQCSMSGQQVNDWRRPNFCSLGECPANQVYQECGMPCMKTCSNPAHSCPSFCTFGCFCPEGMVLDDISKNQSCVSIDQCPCTFNKAIYAPGEVLKATCRTCQCTSGQWICTELPCPGRCSLEGGSFVTTFDSQPYRFHGTCTYILVKSPNLPNNGTLMAVYDKSGYSHSETSLTAVIYSSTKDKIMISQDELLTDDGDIKWLPYQTGDITVFRQTSTHLQMATTFGLELVVQLRPVFQVYVKVGLQFKGNTRGLCGNYNGDTTDDFLSSMNIIEGTASLFVDSWRSGNCPNALERETDPCSMSQLNKMCAETHCSMLVKTGTVFEACHAVVNPTPFYKRCVYQACNYEETFPYICSALGSYARMCASMGLILTDWRSTVDNCTVSCTGNQTFSYDSQACNRTCLSLADHTLECHPSDIPVDGCNCPEGTYLDHRSECVRQSRCPCFLEDQKFILADQSTIISGIPCYCVNGRLSCTGKPPDPSESCKAPKKYLSCSQSSDSKYGAACAPTCQMLATGTDCVPTKCESGCACAEGLYENLNGDCVPPDDCPCEFGGLSYNRGAQIQSECETCTCMRGKWQCLKKDKCSSTCTLYGEGHLTTFDGQRFVFDGNCEYVLTTDGCSTNNSHPTFKIVTENVICGKSGVTCSRAIKLFLGDLSLLLSDASYTITGTNPQVQIQVKKNALHLMFDVIIPSKFNLTLIWNKHMSVFIKVFRDSQDPLCGLCGNYNGNMKDDFEARSKYVASSELEFVNSWKENPLCGDISFVVEPCLQNPYRKAWAEKKCAIINSNTFSACHSKVYRIPYYDACVRDACGCDSGGDCECMCDAVAAYAKACLDVGVCVDWRAPDFCPLYCDFFNTHKLIDGDGSYQYTREANCTWHYQPCLCPFQSQSNKYINIEGCYNCTQDQYFDHEEGRCVPCCHQPRILATHKADRPRFVGTRLSKEAIKQVPRFEPQKALSSELQAGPSSGPSGSFGKARKSRGPRDGQTEAWTMRALAQEAFQVPPPTLPPSSDIPFASIPADLLPPPLRPHFPLSSMTWLKYFSRLHQRTQQVNVAPLNVQMTQAPFSALAPAPCCRGGLDRPGAQ
ncbi:mucin-6 [Trichosurus vulpecula]|uniref:mucin-6 n=1 Tax=Trichosurus vulpecula TaxID=9337 RepID=UPI00186AC076|nr:mucin-6 [Trichosurus vulpecula]